MLSPQSVACDSVKRPVLAVCSRVCHLVGAEVHGHQAISPQLYSSSFCPCSIKPHGSGHWIQKERATKLSAVSGKTRGLGCQSQEIHTQ